MGDHLEATIHLFVLKHIGEAWLDLDAAAFLGDLEQTGMKPRLGGGEEGGGAVGVGHGHTHLGIGGNEFQWALIMEIIQTAFGVASTGL